MQKIIFRKLQAVYCMKQYSAVLQFFSCIKQYLESINFASNAIDLASDFKKKK